MERGDWKCGCGEVNFKKRTDCRKCKTIKPKTNDWNCQCGELNFASRFNCRKCDSERFGPINKIAIIQNPIVVMKPGDWVCSNDLCKEHNFKIRDICRKCNNPKIPEPKPKENNNDDESEDNTCIICLDKPRAYAIIKCGHLCYCDTCGKNINKCPICREVYNPNSDLLKIFNI